MKKLSLKVRQIRELQGKYGITNLLAPSAEDGAKLADVVVLADLYYEGSRGWGDDAPSAEDVEELELADLLGAVKELLSAPDGGK